MFEKFYHGCLFGLGKVLCQRRGGIAQCGLFRGCRQVDQRTFQPQDVGFGQVVIIAREQEKFRDFKTQGRWVALNPFRHIFAF